MISRGMRGAGSGPPNTSAQVYSCSSSVPQTRAPQRPSSATQKNRHFIMIGFRSTDMLRQMAEYFHRQYARNLADDNAYAIMPVASARSDSSGLRVCLNS
jgi:hypothetical protein